MPTMIEINGDLVSVIDRSVRATISLADWLPKIEHRCPIYTPVLPSNCRALWWDPSDLAHQKMVVLLEVAPFISNLDLDGTPHRLTMPWTRFIFFMETHNPHDNNAWRMEDYHIYWSKSRYTNPTAKDMIVALLPNVYEDGRICFGSTGASANQSLADRLDQIVNEFYISRFNHDLNIRRPNNWRGWAAWERATIANQNCWTQWPDLDPTNTPWPLSSWDDHCARYLAADHPRTGPVIAADPIPELALGATFGRINDWLGAMETNQRARLLEAVLQMRAINNEAFEPVPELVLNEDA
jgi:hypothetical protein